jgi:hypothetical protein
VPPHLEAIVRRCLEKERDQRYPSVGDLATDLAGFSPASRVHAERALRVLGTGSSRQSGQMPASLQSGIVTPSGSNPIAAPTPSNLVITPGGTPALVAAPTEASWEASSPRSKTRRWPIVVMVTAVAAVIAAVGYREFAPRSATSTEPPESPSAAIQTPEPPPVTQPEPVLDTPEPPSAVPPVVSVVPEPTGPAESAKPRPSVRPSKPPARPAASGTAKPARPNGDQISDFGGRR